MHAPNDKLRTQIVPTNDKTGITAILEAADSFYHTTGRQVTYEYVVLGGLNDQPGHARELAEPAPRPAGARQPDPVERRGGAGRTAGRHDADLNGLIEALRKAGVSVQVRKRMGAEIDAACGQLRRQGRDGRPGGRVGDGPVSS